MVQNVKPMCFVCLYPTWFTWFSLQRIPISSWFELASSIKPWDSRWAQGQRALFKLIQTAQKGKPGKVETLWLPMTRKGVPTPNFQAELKRKESIGISYELTFEHRRHIDLVIGRDRLWRYCKHSGTWFVEICQYKIAASASPSSLQSFCGKSLKYSARYHPKPRVASFCKICRAAFSGASNCHQLGAGSNCDYNGYKTKQC